MGAVSRSLLAEVARFPNVAVVRSGDPLGGGLDAAIALMAEAASKASPYVLVAADPLGDVANRWREMWMVCAPSAGESTAGDFEAFAAHALTGWREQRFELPDYYLVLAPADVGDGAESASPAPPDFYLGPLRAARPHRVAVVAHQVGPGQAVAVRDALGSLRHGPWWPPLDELLDRARWFFAGAIAESPAANSAPGLGGR